MTEHITTTAFIKNLGYIPAVLIGLSLESYLILAVLMIIDTLFGIMRVFVIYGGHHIKSYKLVSGVVAKITVIGVPVMLAWAGRGSGIDLYPLAQGTLGVLILAEVYSILGSVYAIRIRKDVPEYDAVSAILRGLQKIIEKIIKKDPSVQPTTGELLEGNTQLRPVGLKEKKEQKDIKN